MTGKHEEKGLERGYKWEFERAFMKRRRYPKKAEEISVTDAALHECVKRKMKNFDIVVGCFVI